MKYGFNLLLWTGHVTDEHVPVLKALKRTGYDSVEVPIFEGAIDSYARLGEQLAKMDLDVTTVSVLGAGHDPLSDDRMERQAAVERTKWVIDCTKALGGSIIAGPMHSELGRFTGNGPTVEERKRGIEFHRRAGDDAGKHGMSFALEAVNRFECYFVNTMEDLGAYLDTVDHPMIGALYDTFHANIEEKDPVAAFETIRPHVKHVHITENDRGVPGRGHVPWAETYAAIKRSGYDGWLTIEAFGRALPDLAAATRVWRDFAESPEAVYRDGIKHIKEGWAQA